MPKAAQCGEQPCTCSEWWPLRCWRDRDECTCGYGGHLAALIYRFLAEDFKAYFKGTKKDKNCGIPLLSSSPPAASINHVLIFPACLQGVSTWAREPSLWHPSDLPPFHVNVHSDYNISKQRRDSAWLPGCLAGWLPLTGWIVLKRPLSVLRRAINLKGSLGKLASGLHAITIFI